MPVLSTLGAAIANVYGFTSGLIKDQYFNLVSLLLPGNGTNGAQNNTFLDSGTANSGSGFTITRNGNTTQGTFSPFSQTGWGNYFDGTGDYLTAADNAVFTLGTSDFTIEAWVYALSSGTTDRYFIAHADNASAAGSSFAFYIFSGTSKIYFECYISSTTTTITSDSAIVLNQWNHVAICRSSGTLAMFVNGTRQASPASIGSSSINNCANSLSIGARTTGGSTYTGYLSNARMVVGTDVYGAGNSTITVPTAPLTAITNTQLLTCQSNRFRDASANSFPLTVNGNPSVTPFSPFAPTRSYSAAAVGGSGYFDVVDDFLTWGPGSSVQFGTDNFTIEVWIYQTVTPAGQYIIDARNSSQTTAFALLFGATASGRLAFFDGSIVAVEEATPSIKANEWTHCCVVRSGSTISLFINGVRAGVNSSYSGNMSTAPTLSYIGKRYAAVLGEDFEFPGYMSSLRIVKGTAVYDPTQTNITIPTAPLTAITNTSLLLNFTNAGVVDATAKNVLETVGNAQISTTQSKWGGGSMYFDGSSSYLRAQANSGVSATAMMFGTGPYTIEMWVYQTARNASYGAYIISNQSFQANITGSGTVNANKVGGSDYATTTTTVPLNTWTHIAFVRTSTSANGFKIYINGTDSATGTDSTDYSSATQLNIATTAFGGANYVFTGYIDDLRITRYARTITASPTAPFPVQ